MKKRRILAFALTLVLLAACLPATAFAYEPIYVTSNGVTSTGSFDSLFSGNIIYYPADMAQTNEIYPVVVWANGTMCAPALYHSLLSKIAAAGYIVVTNTNVMSGDGKAQIASINFILAENEKPGSVFDGRVNTDRIAAAGHIHSTVRILFTDGQKLP